MKKIFFNKKDTKKLVENEFLTEDEMQKFIGGRYNDTFYSESTFVNNFNNSYIQDSRLDQ